MPARTSATSAGSGRGSASSAPTRWPRLSSTPRSSAASRSARRRAWSVRCSDQAATATAARASARARARPRDRGAGRRGAGTAPGRSSSSRPSSGSAPRTDTRSAAAVGGEVGIGGSAMDARDAAGGSGANLAAAPTDGGASSCSLTGASPVPGARWRSTRNGLVARSLPMVVTAPCPGSTATSSDSGSTLSTIEAMSCSKEPPGRSVRPMDPAKRWSPLNSRGASPSASRRRHTEPGVCPGVCRTVKVRPAPETRSPSSSPAMTSGGATWSSPRCWASRPPEARGSSNMARSWSWMCTGRWGSW